MARALVRYTLLLVLFAAAFVFAFRANAADLFAEPPREAFGLGLVMAYERNAGTLFQAEEALAVSCGADTFGCLTRMADGYCLAHVWVGLPFDLRERVLRNLLAQCAGWSPPD